MRWLASMIVAMAAMQSTVEAVADAWPTILAVGLIGGLTFAALGWATSRV